MSKRIKRFSVTGVANVETFDSGIQSTANEKRRVTGIFVYCSGHIGNQILADLDQDRHIDLEDFFFITDESVGGTNIQKENSRRDYLKIDLELEVGAVFAVGINCGATNQNVIGGYEYEVIS